MSFKVMGGAYWGDEQFQYSQHRLRGDNRENDLKLAIQAIRKDSSNLYYKGEGRKIIDIKVTRKKDEIEILVTMEITVRKKNKRKKSKAK